MAEQNTSPAHGGDFDPRDLAASFHTSRQAFEIGEPYEVLALLENNSTVPIWITDGTSTLTLPAEIRHPVHRNVAAHTANLPTIPGPVPGAPGTHVELVCIPPRAKYVLLWRQNTNIKRDLKSRRNNKEPSLFFQILSWHLFFHPGNYQAQATIHYWLQKPNMKHIVSYRKFLFLSQSQDTQNYDSDLINNRINLLEETAKSRVFSLSGNLEFTPRSITVLTAAAFGGLIGFGFSQLNKIHQLGEAVEITARDLILLPSFLLTAIIATLIVTRITEARFPLTIQIMDFWGATALGVISALLGDAALRNLLSL